MYLPINPEYLIPDVAPSHYETKKWRWAEYVSRSPPSSNRYLVKYQRAMHDSETRFTHDIPLTQPHHINEQSSAQRPGVDAPSLIFAHAPHDINEQYSASRPDLDTPSLILLTHTPTIITSNIPVWHKARLRRFDLAVSYPLARYQQNRLYFETKILHTILTSLSRSAPRLSTQAPSQKRRAMVSLNALPHTLLCLLTCLDAVRDTGVWEVMPFSKPF